MRGSVAVLNYSFINFVNGTPHSFGGSFIELKPHELIRYVNQFDSPHVSGTLSTTITLNKVFCGTELKITQEGMPAAIPEAACRLGWQESFHQLAKLVEKEIGE